MTNRFVLHTTAAEKRIVAPGRGVNSEWVSTIQNQPTAPGSPTRRTRRYFPVGSIGPNARIVPRFGTISPMLNGLCYRPFDYNLRMEQGAGRQGGTEPAVTDYALRVRRARILSPLSCS